MAAALDAAASAGTDPSAVAVLLLAVPGLTVAGLATEQDEASTDVAGRLLDATRGADVVGWMGGDQFALLLDRIATEADVMIVARRLLGTFQWPSPAPMASLGIARGERGAAGNADDLADVLMRNAELALHEARSRGVDEPVICEIAPPRA